MLKDLGRFFPIFFTSILSFLTLFPQNVLAFDLNITVIDSDNDPVKGAPIKVHSSLLGSDSYIETDISGNATISNASGSYTIHALLTGVSFTPASHTVAVLNSNVSVLFQADTNLGFTGKVTENNNPVSSVGVFVSDHGWAGSNPNGAFGMGNLTSNTVSLIPIKKCESFAPSRISLVVPPDEFSSGINFNRVSTGLSTVWGRITRQGVPVSLAFVSLKQGNTIVATVNTDQSGYYVFQGVSNGSYTLEADKADYVFAPKTRNLVISACDIFSNQNFLSATTSDRFTVRGHLTFQGQPMANVEVVGGSAVDDPNDPDKKYEITNGVVRTANDGSYEITGYPFLARTYIFPRQIGFRSNPPRFEMNVLSDMVSDFDMFKTVCNDGIDNDSDGETDYPGDQGCLSIDSMSESERTLGCLDGLDNDGDGLLDLADPGCSTAQDMSERDPNGPLCDNGSDDDNDGLGDFPLDPGCSSATDLLETAAELPCDDGVDNDSDSVIDLADPGCIDSRDNSEVGFNACDNGIDDDGDGFSDIRDPGCESVGDIDETRADGPQCDNGKDDDADVKVDMKDPGCTDPFDGYEGDDNECTKFVSDSLQNVLSEGTTSLESYGVEAAKKLRVAALSAEKELRIKSLRSSTSIMKRVQKASRDNISLVTSLPAIALSCPKECETIDNSEMIKRFKRNVRIMHQGVARGTTRFYFLRGVDLTNSAAKRGLAFRIKARKEARELLKLADSIPTTMELCSPS